MRHIRNLFSFMYVLQRLASAPLFALLTEARVGLEMNTTQKFLRNTLLSNVLH